MKGAAAGRPLRVGVEASALRAGRTGIGCYVEKLLEAFAEPDIEMRPFSNRPVDGHPTASVRRLRPTALWLRTLAPRQALGLDLDLVHFPTGRAPRPPIHPMVVTIHDLEPLTAAGLPRRERWLTAAALRRGIETADAIIAVSTDTAGAIRSQFPQAASRLTVIPEGPTVTLADPAWASSALRAQLGLIEEAPIWLHVGASEPRKQLPELVAAHAAALATLRARGRPDALLPVLVLAGPPGADDRRLRAAVARCGTAPWVRLTGSLPRPALAGLYRLAELYVAMSLHEGFGLAVLDAMGFGLPVLSSGRGSLGELAEGGAAWVLDLDEAAAVSAGLLRLHDAPSLRQALGEAARLRAGRYAWPQAARATAELYRSLLPLTRRSA